MRTTDHRIHFGCSGQRATGIAPGEKCCGKEIYLPLADDFLLEVDRAKRELKLVVPEGLLDL